MKHYAIQQKDGSYFSEWLCNIIEVCSLGVEHAMTWNEKTNAEKVAARINKARGFEKYTVKDVTNTL